MTMPGRSYQATTSSSYRFSFNGQEKSDEIFEGSTTALFWEYDSRTGRRWNVDPVLKVWESPYFCFSGNPVLLSDPFGDDANENGKKKKKKKKPSAKTTSNQSNSKPSTTVNNPNTTGVTFTKTLSPSLNFILPPSLPTPIWTKPPTTIVPVPTSTTLTSTATSTSTSTAGWARFLKPAGILVSALLEPTPTGMGASPQPKFPNYTPKDDKNVYIYRTMKEDVLGNPLVGESANMLGIRPDYVTTSVINMKGSDWDYPKDGKDMKVTSDLYVNAIGGFLLPTTGMSASFTIDGLPNFRKPKLFGGSTNGTLYKINVKYLLLCGLGINPDKPPHVLVVPISSGLYLNATPYSTFMANLEKTVIFWEKVTKK